MHSLKYLHRDIKPENIFLTSLGKFRLGDFGLAIKYDEEVPFSRSGTLDYMAPEVCTAAGGPVQQIMRVVPAQLASGLVLAAEAIQQSHLVYAQLQDRK